MPLAAEPARKLLLCAARRRPGHRATAANADDVDDAADHAAIVHALRLEELLRGGRLRRCAKVPLVALRARVGNGAPPFPGAARDQLFCAGLCWSGRCVQAGSAVPFTSMARRWYGPPARRARGGATDLAAAG